MRTGLPRRFAPRNDEGGAGRFAPCDGGETSGGSFSQRMDTPSAAAVYAPGLPRRFAPRNDEGGAAASLLAMAFYHRLSLVITATITTTIRAVTNVAARHRRERRLPLPPSVRGA
jgi:hypothetical protein